ncbi:MAG: hypothetical protein LH650_16335 [Chloroflexi bacterium]|nr:hypothetical protein [Chloroflexota bacterium]
MTTAEHTDLDRVLTSALAVLPTSGALGRTDARIATAITTPDLGRSRLPVPWRSRKLGLSLLSVTVVLTTAAGGVTLIDRVFRDSTPAWELAWSQAKPLSLSQTVHGVTVGVEGAYMDASRIVIGLTMDGYHYASAQLRVDGREAGGGAVYQVPSKSGSAAVLNFSTPPDVGAWAKVHLTVPYLYGPGAGSHEMPSMSAPSMSTGTSEIRRVLPGRVDGPWDFTFSLASAGGTTWTGAVTDVASGVTMTLDRIAVSPTSVSASLTWSGDPLKASGDDVWSATGRMQHGDQRFMVGSGSTSGNRAEIGGQPGSDDQGGEWTIRIDKITSDPGYPPKRVTIEGPWVFRVTMPR